jgi:hypothetical protein
MFCRIQLVLSRLGGRINQRTCCVSYLLPRKIFMLPAQKGENYMKLEIPYNDLRSWLDLAGEIGEVRGVEGASWQEDIGMASELINRRDPAPAVLFDKIPGYPAGHRVLVNFFGGRRKSMTLGLPPGSNNFQLSEAFTEAFQETKPIPYWRTSGWEMT